MMLRTLQHTHISKLVSDVRDEERQALQYKRSITGLVGIAVFIHASLVVASAPEKISADVGMREVMQ